MTPLFWGRVGACLLCFAGNSLICRAALGRQLIGPEAFTLIRLASGSAALLAFAGFRGVPGLRRAGSPISAAALFLYAACFSFAYLRLDAGVGALVLFGVVQTTMIGWSLRTDRAPAAGEWTGLGLAVGGLSLLTIPGKEAPDLGGVGLMTAAGVGWGIYSLRGRAAGDPLNATALNFFLSLPLALGLMAWSPTMPGSASSVGIGLAILSGVVTSGLGYTLWYGVVPKLGAVRAGIVQLAVPAVALLLSVLFLAESFNVRTAIASALILSGVAWALLAKARA